MLHLFNVEVSYMPGNSGPATGVGNVRARNHGEALFRYLNSHGLSDLPDNQRSEARVRRITTTSEVAQ